MADCARRRVSERKRRSAAALGAEMAEFTSPEHFIFPRNPKRRTRRNVVSFFLERATRLEPASRHPANGSRHSQEPCLTSIGPRLRRGVEAASSPSNKKTGHPTLGVLFHAGAGNEARTRYLHLGKVALYQMSYARGTRGILTKKHPLVKPLL